MANLKPLQDAIKLLADVAIDSVKAASDTTASAKLSEFDNILPDLLVLFPEISEVPSAIASLAPSDIASLIASAEADLVLPAGKGNNIVQASLKMLSNIASVTVPDITALIGAIES